MPTYVWWECRLPSMCCVHIAWARGLPTVGAGSCVCVGHHPGLLDTELPGVLAAYSRRTRFPTRGAERGDPGLVFYFTFLLRTLCNCVPHPGQWRVSIGQPSCLGCRHALDTHTGACRCLEAWTHGGCLQALPSCSQPPALSQLVSLYLGRSHFLWKEPATISWLEETVREVLQAVDAGDPAVEACESR